MNRGLFLRVWGPPGLWPLDILFFEVIESWLTS